MITLKNEDCFDLLSSLDSESIDAVISDIPYGIGFHSMNDPDTGWDNFEDQEYYNFLVQLFRDTYRVTTKIMFLFIAPTRMFDVIRASKESDWKFLPEYTYYYCRAKGRQAKCKLKSLREDILCFVKKDGIIPKMDQITEYEKYRTVSNKPIGYSLDVCTGMRIPQYSLVDRSFFITSPSYNNIGDKQIHSCQKPLSLMAYLIRMCTDEGDTILDPFAGSGSTAIAAHFCNRNFIGSELDTDMFNKANERIKEATNKMSREYESIKNNLAMKFTFGLV